MLSQIFLEINAAQVLLSSLSLQLEGYKALRISGGSTTLNVHANFSADRPKHNATDTFILYIKQYLEQHIIP